MKKRLRNLISKTSLKKMIIWVPLSIIIIYASFPLYWSLNTSLKLPENVVTVPPDWYPKVFTIDNYLRAFRRHLPEYFINSIILALGSVAVVLLIASPAGYAAARLKFKGKEAILFFLLATMMVPSVVIIVPLYILLIRIGLINTFVGLILIYSAWRVPFALWILRSFFASISKDLEDAAMIDGTTRIGALFRVVLPLTRPGITAAAVAVFVYVWNEFIIALTLLSAHRVVPVGLYYFVTGIEIEWGPLTAALISVLAPIIVFFWALERQLVQGLTAGAVKE